MPPGEERIRIATAVIGAGVAGLVAWEHPEVIPALTVALVVWVAMCAFLKL